MALNIKDEETDRLARELARATGESITEAARTAIAERLARVRGRESRRADVDVLTAVIERGRAREVLDDRSEDDLLGYDASGIPT